MNKPIKYELQSGESVIIETDIAEEGIVKAGNIEEIIEKANKLKVISKYGTGLDNIDINIATKKKIIVTNTPSANVDAVADLTFGFILSLARRIPEADRKTKSGKWEKIIGKSVWEKTLGVIGLGKIGRQIVRRAQGFKMNISHKRQRLTRDKNVFSFGTVFALLLSDVEIYHFPETCI